MMILDKNNKIQSYKKLTNNTTKTLLNKLFMLDQERNKVLINKYIRQKQITWRDHNDWPAPIANLGLSKIGDFGQVLHLWGKMMVTKDRRTEHFSVSAKLLYVK